MQEPLPGQVGHTKNGAPDTNRLSPQLRRAAILDRRARVWELKARGVPTSRIAKVIGISERAVKHHAAKAAAKVIAGLKANVQAHLAEEVALTESVITALSPKREDPRVADAILRASERRSKLRGTEPTQRVALQNPDGTPLRADGQTVNLVFNAALLGTDELRALSEALARGLTEAPPAVEAPSNVVALPPRQQPTEG